MYFVFLLHVHLKYTSTESMHPTNSMCVTTSTPSRCIQIIYSILSLNINCTLKVTMDTHTRKVTTIYEAQHWKSDNHSTKGNMGIHKKCKGKRDMQRFSLHSAFQYSREEINVYGPKTSQEEGGREKNWKGKKGSGKQFKNCVKDGENAGFIEGSLCKHCGKQNHAHFKLWRRPNVKCRRRHLMGTLIEKYCKETQQQGGALTEVARRSTLCGVFILYI